jgi:hypothetical protein
MSANAREFFCARGASGSKPRCSRRCFSICLSFSSCGRRSLPFWSSNKIERSTARCSRAAISRACSSRIRWRCCEASITRCCCCAMNTKKIPASSIQDACCGPRRWVDHSECISGQSGEGKTLLGDTVLANFADREWFVRQRDAKVDKLDIAEPAVGRLSGKWIIFCRGGCAIPTAALPAWSPRRSTRSSSAAFTRRSTSAHGTVVLRNLDGVILASGGASTPAMGRQ